MEITNFYGFNLSCESSNEDDIDDIDVNYNNKE